MNLTEMRTCIRRDLKDYIPAWEASTAYLVGQVVVPTAPTLHRKFECTTAGTSAASEPTWDYDVDDTTTDNTVAWTCRDNDQRWPNDEIDRHIAHALREFSQVCPWEQKATLATVADSREIDISSLIDRVKVLAVDYPIGKFPPVYQRFSLWEDIITLLGSDVPDGSNCYIFYGKLHTLDASSSTVPSQHEDVVAIGAEAYAALEWASYATDRVGVGGDDVDRSYRTWGKERLRVFRKELKKLKSKLRTTSLYKPYYPPGSKTTDWGP